MTDFAHIGGLCWCWLHVGGLGRLTFMVAGITGGTREEEERHVQKETKTVSQNGSITVHQLMIDESLLVEPKILFIRSKIGKGAHGKVYEGRCCSCSWWFFSKFKYCPSSAYNSPFFTTNSGAPVWNNNSLTVGSRGLILLKDYHLVEKLANFDRERIPKHVVHARGASAKGFFEVTHDVSHLTCANFLRAHGVQTLVIVQFSTIIHERGSPETLRDPRGFAVKFLLH